MFDNLRKNISRLVYPEVHVNLSSAVRDYESRVKTNTAIYDARDALRRQLTEALESAALQAERHKARNLADDIKALNWDHLVKSHESGELEDAFVVCRLDEQGVLSPITCQKDELSSAVYLDRLKHGAVKAD